MARIWNASATESSGGRPDEELINAVPASFAGSRLVVSGTTRTESSLRVSVSLCRLQGACAPSVPEVDMNRGQPTRPLLVSTPLRCLQRTRPLGETLLSKRKVIPVPGSLQSRQIPSTGVRPPHHNQLHTLTGQEAQVSGRPQHTIFIPGFNQSHDNDHVALAPRMVYRFIQPMGSTLQKFEMRPMWGAKTS